MLNISGGIKNTPQRVIVYGCPAVGKTTFASRFENCVFLDFENSTNELDVQRLDCPKTWNGVKRLMSEILAEDSVPFATICFDSLDWLEKVAGDAVAKQNNKKTLASIPYGRGNLELAEAFKELLDTLQEIQDKHGVHVVFTAHSVAKHYDPPTMIEGYTRFELNLTKHVNSLMVEWSSVMLFCDFESTVEKNERGVSKGTGTGSNRIMYTQKCDVADAKNRVGLAPILPFAYKHVAHIFGGAVDE
jgi:hypothetical protein